jgi:hypothetical protein
MDLDKIYVTWGWTVQSPKDRAGYVGTCHLRRSTHVLPSSNSCQSNNKRTDSAYAQPFSEFTHMCQHTHPSMGKLRISRMRNRALANTHKHHQALGLERPARPVSWLFRRKPSQMHVANLVVCLNNVQKLDANSSPRPCIKLFWRVLVALPARAYIQPIISGTRDGSRA